MLIEKKTLTVASLYVNSSTKTSCNGILEGLRLLAEGSMVIFGDFNAWYPAWGARRSNKRGRELQAEAECGDLDVANDGSPTFPRNRGVAFSSDVTFHNLDMIVICSKASGTWSSDNFPKQLNLCPNFMFNTWLAKIIYWDTLCAALEMNAKYSIVAITTAIQKATKTAKVPKRP